MIHLQVVIVNLQCAVGPRSCEPYNVILVVIYFDSDFANRMIVCSHIVNGEYVAFNLQTNIAHEINI